MRWTKSEIELARRICDNKKFIEAEVKEETVQEQMKRIMDQPLVPLYGNEPPWWEKAVAWADQRLVWIRGYGWMPASLWEDMRKCHDTKRTPNAD